MKRFIDVTIASGLLLLATPLAAAVALAVRLFMGAPVLFRQQRPGLGGTPFQLLKFRTMLDAADAQGNPLPDDQRLTTIGRLLRRTSVDELPQLWNVVRGDMSLVGPRPLLMEYLVLYSERQARRHDVRPGITGWAQINGRNALGWRERLELDVWYVENRSLSLDMRILARTASAVLLGRGVSHAGEATMPKFTGNE